MLVPFFVQKPVKKRFYMYSLLEKYTEGESQMKDKIFSVLQRVGRSFMLPDRDPSGSRTSSWYRKFFHKCNDD